MPAQAPVPVPDHSGGPAVPCDRCGTTMVEHHCKLQCPRCGFTRDCSDP
ncbi:MAG: HVO_2523 family zinc finger protein [Candidatus Methylomirabilales bacterium]